MHFDPQNALLNACFICHGGLQKGMRLDGLNVFKLSYISSSTAIIFTNIAYIYELFYLTLFLWPCII